MIYAAIYVAFFQRDCPDVVFCDIVSACIPVLRLNRKIRVLFYCHFPDQLLSKPEGRLKKLYRFPLNWMEEVTTGMAHKVLVNSKFTAKVFETTFKRLATKIKPYVLYPCVDLSNFIPLTDKAAKDALQDVGIPNDSILLLSINRYERKKNLYLAIDTMSSLKDMIPDKMWPAIHLVMAGGYDVRVKENVEHHKELVEHANKIGVANKVTFLKSPSDSVKVGLLQSARCLLYTPTDEHFGIVPIEAMSAGCPVVAVCSGGPTETVVDGLTGFLCQPLPQSFAEAVAKLLVSDELVVEMGKEGRNHVKISFSNEAFADALNSEIECQLDVLDDSKKR